jgi:hypothetical protein
MLSHFRLTLAAVAMTAALVVPAAASAQSICAIPQNCQINNPPIAVAQYPRQLVTNGRFEDPNATLPNGSAAWTGWHMSYRNLSNDPRFHAHCGANAMYLNGFIGGGNATTVRDGGHMTQRLSIPAGANGTALDFWLYFPNQLVEYEELVVKAVDVAQLPPPFSSNPIPWVNLTTVNNRTLAKNTWQHVGPIDMSAFVGQTILLKFQARTDLQYPDASQSMPVVTEEGFYIDDVAVWTPGLHLSIC